MATDPNTLNDEPQEPEVETPVEDDVTPEVAELAREMGWRPREEYRGPEGAYKDARTYIRNSQDVLSETNRELKSLRSTVDTIAKTNGSIVEQEVNRRVDELANKYQQAVDDGDGVQAYRYSQEIGQLVAQPQQQQRGPSPEAQGFAERNASWFQRDPLATQLAVDVCNRLSSYPPETQLAAAQREVARVYPHLFSQQRQAGVNAPSSRGPGGKPSGSGYAGMPQEAKKVADDMVSRGVIPDREAYAKNYWQNAGGKA